MSHIIEIDNLSKNFGDVKAVDKISFHVDDGEFFAFLGVNGAGKSTTINILVTLLDKDEGEVKVVGCDVAKNADEVRGEIGIVFQNSVLDKRLSVRDNLAVRASFYGLSGDALDDRLAELSKLLELDGLMKRPYGKLSGGQRRRVDIARALINKPRVLILDEPTTGLDPQTRRTVWDIIGMLRETTGMTVFLTTHYMEEANEAEYVIIIDEGRIAAKGTPVELKNNFSSDYIRIYSPENAEIEAKLEGREFDFDGNYYRVKVTDSADALEFISSHADILSNFEVIKGDMNDVFLNVTGKSLRG